MPTNQAKTATIETTDIEWSAIEGENSEFAVQYPRMQWVHGEKKASGFNKSGGLFISAEQYPNFQGEGFTAETFISRKDEIPGFAAASAKLAVIRVKHQWVKEEGRNIPLVHALVVVKGCEDLLCFSLRGASKALEFQKAFNQHMAHNVALANRTRPSTAPAIEPFALWFPLQAGPIETITSKDGKNESSVTLPTMLTPETHDRDYIKTLWVGTDNYKTFAGFWKETTAWQKTPIWEQRNELEVPEYSGGSEFQKATDPQLRALINLANIKSADEKEYSLQITNGATDRFENLSSAEAASLIELLKTL